MSRYELLERIGVGGMAEIFRGRATAMGGFEKPVAIKKILPHLGRDDRFVRMLIAEAKILAGFRQRNIVQVYDVGLGEDGEYFLVMEYVEGCDLGNLYDAMEAQRVRFPMDLALHIGSEVCDALDHAHKATDPDGKPIGLVHRDVSPSNVLLSLSGEVKLTDFGIAKKLEDHSVATSIVGKFAYMSPEQARAAKLDGKSDIYSLGVLLYELLLNRRLYSGANEFEALRLVREARVPKPRDVDPTFSRELESLLLKALAPDPKQRYDTAAAFAAALRDFRYSASTSAGDPAKEIASLVKRFAPPKGGSVRQATPEAHKVVRIETVAGFGDESSPGEMRQIFDSFDAPTRAVDRSGALLRGGDTGEAASLADSGVIPPPIRGERSEGAERPQSILRPPSRQRRAVPAHEATGARPLDAAGFDAERPTGDDAETRLIDTRAAGASARAPAIPAGAIAARASGKEPTPTVKDLPLGSLFDELESSNAALPAAPPSAFATPGVPVVSDLEMLSNAPRKRAAMWAVGVLIVATLLAFVIAGYLVAGGGDKKDGGERKFTPSTAPAGQALDTPAIAPPVKQKPAPPRPPHKK